MTCFIVRRPSRQQRRRALREAIYQSYESAAADPAFMAEHQASTRELDPYGRGRIELESNRTCHVVELRSGYVL